MGEKMVKDVLINGTSFEVYNNSTLIPSVVTKSM